MGPLRSLGEALLTTKREEIRAITFEDFVTSLRKVRPSVSKKGLHAFEKWNDEFGSKG
jgi:fidgetin-like protein 1